MLVKWPIQRYLKLEALFCHSIRDDINSFNNKLGPNNSGVLKDMNKRALFTRLITQLLIEMSNEGELPVIDWALRSKEVQRMFFDKGLSKCDGTVKVSKHQLGRAMDIYLCDDKGNIVFEWDSAKAKKWHDRWVEIGGNPMIDWDRGHYDL